MANHFCSVADDEGGIKRRSAWFATPAVKPDRVVTKGSRELNYRDNCPLGDQRGRCTHVRPPRTESDKQIAETVLNIELGQCSSWKGKKASTYQSCTTLS